MKRILLTLLMVAVLALSLAACGPKQPASHLEAIKAAGVIKVGTSADYPPFEYVDASGNKAGFDIDLMEEIAKRMGVKVEWVDMPFDSLIAAVQEGKIDMSISAFNYTEERDQTVDFTEAYYTSEDSFMVLDSLCRDDRQSRRCRRLPGWRPDRHHPGLVADRKPAGYRPAFRRKPVPL